MGGIDERAFKASNSSQLKTTASLFANAAALLHILITGEAVKEVTYQARIQHYKGLIGERAAEGGVGTGKYDFQAEVATREEIRVGARGGGAGAGAGGEGHPVLPRGGRGARPGWQRLIMSIESMPRARVRPRGH